MLVEHTLGIAGGARGIAEPARLALVAVDPGEILVAAVDPLAELAVVHADIMFDRLPRGLHLLDQRRERLVVKQDPVLGVIGDIGELVGEQPRIDGVKDAAHPDRAIPAGQVMGVVHRQRRDTVALGDAQTVKRLGHAPRVFGDAAPIGAGDGLVGPGTDDLSVAMLALRMIDQPHHAQWPVLHCPE